MSKARAPTLSLVGGEGSLYHVLHCDGNLKALVLLNDTAELLSCKLLSTLAAGKTIILNTVHDTIEITDGELCQNSVLWKAVERHGQIAEF